MLIVIPAQVSTRTKLTMKHRAFSLDLEFEGNLEAGQGPTDAKQNSRRLTCGVIAFRTRRMLTTVSTLLFSGGALTDLREV